jgi:protein TonB
MSRTLLFSLSLLAHAALAVWLGEIRVEKARAATAIEIAEVKKEKPKLPEPAKLDEPPPRKSDNTPRSRQAPPTPAPEPPPTPASEQAFNDLPDFGLSLGGGAGAGGIAVPQGRPNSAPAPQRVVKQLAAPAAQAASDGCEEPSGKPKPISVPQPAYTEAARSAGVEGRVRVQLTVDEQGTVADVRVLQGLGHGLDEAALAAARSARFEPALRCGRPTRATFTISMRFSAS